MRLHRLFPLALAVFASPAGAQVTATLPVTCNASGSSCTQATPVTNPDGTNIGSGGGGGTPTGSAGSPNAAVVSVQGISGGTAQAISAASLPLPTGAATEATMSAQSAKLPASLGAKTGATSFSVVPNTDTAFPISAASLPLPTGAATSALQTTMSGQLTTISGQFPASLGAKTGATSLSVVPNSDTAFTVVGNVASGTTDSGNPVKAAGKYNVSAPTFTDGQRGDLQIDSGGVLKVKLSASGVNAVVAALQSDAGGAPSGSLAASSYAYMFNGTTYDRQRGDTNGTYVVASPTATAANAITPVVTSVAAGSVVGKASAGNLYGINVTTGASAGYILIFNATSAPADGTVTPVKCLPIAANTGVDLSYRPLPVAFSTGITAVFSTTGCFTKTISATAFISVDVK